MSASRDLGDRFTIRRAFPLGFEPLALLVRFAEWLGGRRWESGSAAGTMGAGLTYARRRHPTHGQGRSARNVSTP